MEDSITPVSIANSIMEDETYQGYYLIVEGSKDCKLYRKFVKKDNVKIIPAFGKDRVGEVIQILEDRKYNRVFAIIDSDFDRILECKNTKNNIFSTDYHDSEVMMLRAKILEDIIYTYSSSSEKIKRFEEEKGMTIEEIVVKLGEEIGILKLANRKENLGLLFKPKGQDDKPLKYEKFIDKSNLNYLGRDKLIDTVKEYSRTRTSHAKERAEVIEAYTKTVEWWNNNKEDYNVFDLVNGHDLSNIIFIFINKVIKIKSGSISDINDLENKFILAYDITDFLETTLFNNLWKWSIDNGIRVFNDAIEKSKGLDVLYTIQEVSV